MKKLISVRVGGIVVGAFGSVHSTAYRNCIRAIKPGCGVEVIRDNFAAVKKDHMPRMTVAPNRCTGERATKQQVILRRQRCKIKMLRLGEFRL